MLLAQDYVILSLEAGRGSEPWVEKSPFGDALLLPAGIYRKF
jgi:hypothetical protein